MTLTSNEVEAANRAEATAILIRAGYRVYRPEADCYGEDLVLRDRGGILHAVQMKSRPTVDWKKLGGMIGYGCFFQTQGAAASVIGFWSLTTSSMNGSNNGMGTLKNGMIRGVIRIFPKTSLPF